MQPVMYSKRPKTAAAGGNPCRNEKMQPGTYNWKKPVAGTTLCLKPVT